MCDGPCMMHAVRHRPHPKCSECGMGVARKRIAGMARGRRPVSHEPLHRKSALGAMLVRTAATVGTRAPSDEEHTVRRNANRGGDKA